MIKQEEESIIINTASMAGLISGSFSPIYLSGKHAVVTITESLELQLQEKKSKVKAFVFCPGYVKTRLHESSQSSPELQNDPNDPYYQSEDYKKKQGMMQYAVPMALSWSKR